MFTEVQIQEARSYASSFPLREAEECLKRTLKFSTQVTEQEMDAHALKCIRASIDIKEGKLDDHPVVKQRIHHYLRSLCSPPICN